MSPYKAAFQKRGYCICFTCSRVPFPPRYWSMCLWTRLKEKSK